MTETDRHARNATRLSELYPTFRARIAAVIAALEAEGYRPRIQDAWRSVADQLAAYKSGHSKLRYGFHNVTAQDGTPEALAVDLIDDDHPLASAPAYLIRLAAYARAHGLVTGILWGLTGKVRAATDSAIGLGYKDAAVKIGWDPTHVEPTGLTAAEAGYGKRPA